MAVFFSTLPSIHLLTGVFGHPTGIRTGRFKWTNGQSGGFDEAAQRYHRLRFLSLEFALFAASGAWKNIAEQCTFSSSMAAKGLMGHLGALQHTRVLNLTSENIRTDHTGNNRGFITSRILMTSRNNLLLRELFSSNHFYFPWKRLEGVWCKGHIFWKTEFRNADMPYWLLS